MRVRAEFEHEVVQEDTWVPLPDGTRLWARVWRPAGQGRFPALLEYLPYRAGDWTAPRDAQRHPWYAGHGYASVRVDLRGSGNSGGTMVDEYTETELADGEAVLAWLAAQPWCTGAVGMFGISWGGFNSLQLAARRPPALKAVVTVCSTDDRFDNDVHYTGGALLGIDMVAWAGTMLAFTARPPDPAVVGRERWRGLWQERLDALEPFLHPWLSHQSRDDYWRRGSVGEDPAAIEAAVLAVGGLADPYRDTVLRLVAELPGTVRGVLGPWAHRYPDIDLPPGPQIGFLQETLRWWDEHLRGVPTGVLDEPALRTYLQDAVPPATTYPQRAGRWVADASWPSPDVDVVALGFAADAAPHPAALDGVVLVDSPQHTGIDAGRFFPFGNPADLPPDQREDDARSVCFDVPVPEAWEVQGRPVARLRLASSAPRGHVVVRLCDVAPDGSSTLVTRGVLNLLTREGRDRAVECVPGEVVDVVVDLGAAGYVLPAGHRARIAVSNAYWPWVWPHGEAGTLQLHVDGCSLDLPLRRPGVDDGRAAPAFEEPEQAAPLPLRRSGSGGPDRPERVVRRDVAAGEWVLEVDPDYGGSRVFADGLEYAERTRETYRVLERDPSSATATSEWEVSLRRDDVSGVVTTRTELTADAATFRCTSTVRATATDADGTTVLLDRTWRRDVPRTAV